MKTISFVIFLLSANLVFAQENLSASLQQDKIVAVVNHEVVTQSELEELLAVFYMQLANQYSEERIQEEMEKMRKVLLSRLIEDKLILEEAKKQKLEVSEQVFEQSFAEIKNKFKNETEFQSALGEQGLTLSDFKKRIKEQLLMSAMVEQKVKKGITVSPSEITVYYQAYPAEFIRVESVEVDSILCASKDSAQRALSLLSNGKDFKEAKDEFSSGTSLGIIKKGELAKNIEDVIFNLKEAETSAIVETETGFYIFKLLRKIPEAKASLSDMQEKIRDYLVREKMDKRFSEWIEDLKKNAYIIIK